MLLIPLEFGSRGDQVLNAKSFVANGWAHSVSETTMTGKSLLEAVDNLQRRGKEIADKQAAASIDLALMVDVYHEFQFPYEMMLELAKALKPGGRIIFVEYRREDPQVPIKLVHKMSEKQVKKEVSPSEFGLIWKETIEKLPRQHIIIFQRLADNS